MIALFFLPFCGHQTVKSLSVPLILHQNDGFVNPETADFAELWLMAKGVPFDSVFYCALKCTHENRHRQKVKE